MAKETKTATLNVLTIGEDAELAGACVARIVKASVGKSVKSIELAQNSVKVNSEHESPEEFAIWASNLEADLRAFVSRGKATPAPTLPRSAEG